MKAKKLFPDISFRRLVRPSVPVDNLESADIDRPLSANMGREIKENINTIENGITKINESINNIESDMVNRPLILGRPVGTSDKLTYQLETNNVYLVAGAHSSGEPCIAMIFTYSTGTPIIKYLSSGSYMTLSITNMVLSITMQYGHACTVTKL